MNILGAFRSHMRSIFSFVANLAHGSQAVFQNHPKSVSTLTTPSLPSIHTPCRPLISPSTYTNMAQNSSNKLASASGSGGRKTKSTTKKGARSIPPKKHTAVVSRTMQKNLSAKINNSIERQMVNAASGGKLTIMKGSGDPADKAKDTKGVSKPTKSGLKFDKPNPHDRANI